MCQVCHHEPLDKSLCTPNKTLRTTIKVFLKKKLLERAKEQKKKDDEAAKAAAAAAAAAAAKVEEVPVPSNNEATPDPIAVEHAPDAQIDDMENSLVVKSEGNGTPQPGASVAQDDNSEAKSSEAKDASPSAGMDVPQQSIEVCLQTRRSAHTN